MANHFHLEYRKRIATHDYEDPIKKFTPNYFSPQLFDFFYARY